MGHACAAGEFAQADPGDAVLDDHLGRSLQQFPAEVAVVVGTGFGHGVTVTTAT
jgi:hypothetical protein